MMTLANFKIQKWGSSLPLTQQGGCGTLVDILICQFKALLPFLYIAYKTDRKPTSALCRATLRCSAATAVLKWQPLPSASSHDWRDACP